MSSTRLLITSISALAPVLVGYAQNLSLPQVSPKATVSQTIGITEVSVEYHRPSANDREIWGKLVPYGLTNQGFGTATEAPWRAGANMNTLIRFGHGATVEGKPIAAGTYGLHMITHEDDRATVIFSHDTQSWGSYFYDPARDALRVDVPMQDEARFTEMLTYNFTKVTSDSAVLSLEWGERHIPITINVDTLAIVTENLAQELKSAAGFTYQSFLAASQYLQNNDGNLDLALEWAESAVSAPFIGEKNYNSLSNKAAILKKLEREDEAATTMDEAIEFGNVLQLHQYGRQLIGERNPERALEVFIINAERHPETWPTNMGLARGYSAMGDFDKGLEHLLAAQKNVPEGDALNPPAIVDAIEKAKRGEDFN